MPGRGFFHHAGYVGVRYANTNVIRREEDHHMMTYLSSVSQESSEA